MRLLYFLNWIEIILSTVENKFFNFNQLVPTLSVGTLLQTLCVFLWPWQADTVPQSGLKNMPTQSVGTSPLVEKVKKFNFQCSEYSVSKEILKIA